VSDEDGFDTLRRSRCECGAEMAWTKTLAGKSIPLSTVTGNPRANLLLDDEARAVTVSPGEGRYITHFADCPIGVRFRKRR